MTVETTDIGRYIAKQLETSTMSIITNWASVYYVDGVNGDDDNPGTSVSPMASLTGVEAILPLVIDHPVVIYLLQHAGSGYDCPTFRTRMYRENVYVVGVPKSSLSTGTVSAPSATTLSVSTAMNADAYRGKFLEITSGTHQGSRRLLMSNTTSSVTPAVGFTSNLSSGDSYEIFEPVVNLTVPNVTYWQLCSGYGTPTVFTGDQSLNSTKGLYFVNVNFVFAAATNVSFHGPVVMYGVKLSNHSIFFTGYSQNSSLNIGCDSQNAITVNGGSQGPDEDLGVASNTGWYGYGLSASQLLLFIKCNTETVGLVTTGAQYWGTGQHQLRGYNLYSAGLVVQGQQNGFCTVTVTPKVSNIGDVPCYITSTGVGVDVNGKNAYLNLQQTTVQGASVGIRSRNDGHIEMQLASAVTATTAVTGIGMQAIRGGKLTFRNSAAPTMSAAIELSAGQATPTTGTVAGLANDTGITHADGSMIYRSGA